VNAKNVGLDAFESIAENETVGANLSFVHLEGITSLDIGNDRSNRVRQGLESKVGDCQSGLSWTILEIAPLDL